MATANADALKKGNIFYLSVVQPVASSLYRLSYFISCTAALSDEGGGDCWVREIKWIQNYRRVRRSEDAFRKMRGNIKMDLKRNVFRLD